MEVTLYRPFPRPTNNNIGKKKEAAFMLRKATGVFTLLLSSAVYAVPPGTEDEIAERIKPFGTLARAEKSSVEVVPAVSVVLRRRPQAPTYRWNSACARSQISQTASFHLHPKAVQ